MPDWVKKARDISSLSVSATDEEVIATLRGLADELERLRETCGYPGKVIEIHSWVPMAWLDKHEAEIKRLRQELAIYANEYSRLSSKLETARLYRVLRELLGSKEKSAAAGFTRRNVRESARLEAREILDTQTKLDEIRKTVKEPT
jgi:hypothetical protein